MTAEVRERLLDAVVETCGDVTAACKLAGISKQTLYQHRRHNLEFAAALARARLAAEDYALETAREELLHRRFGAIQIQTMSDRNLMKYMKYHERRVRRIESSGSDTDNRS
jgi:transposase-like protein